MLELPSSRMNEDGSTIFSHVYRVGCSETFDGLLRMLFNFSYPSSYFSLVVNVLQSKDPFHLSLFKWDV
jgi:hypothetical protein